MQNGTLEVCRIRVDDRETQAQRTVDRHEALKFPEAMAGADRSVGVAGNPFQKSGGSFWAAIKGGGIKEGKDKMQINIKGK